MRIACKRAVPSLAGIEHQRLSTHSTAKLSGQVGLRRYLTHSSEARMWLAGSPQHHIKHHKGRVLAWELEEGSGTRALRPRLRIRSNRTITTPKCTSEKSPHHRAEHGKLP